MANPQKENGYTAIANEILDRICWYRISGEEHLVLWSVIRKTYGYNKKEDHIALSQLAQMTRLKKPTVQRAIKKLLSKNMLIIKKDNGLGNSYRFNKDYDSWSPLSKKIMGIKNDNGGESKKRHTKDNILKTIYKDSKVEQGSTDIVTIIDLFKPINPSYQKWFSNTTQRNAITRMLKIHGMEKLRSVIPFIEKSNKVPYLPTITTPLQLEDKWSSLEAGVIKMKTEITNKNKVAFI